jgi:hypothetical protein
VGCLWYLCARSVPRGRRRRRRRLVAQLSTLDTEHPYLRISSFWGGGSPPGWSSSSSSSSSSAAGSTATAVNYDAARRGGGQPGGAGSHWLLAASTQRSNLTRELTLAALNRLDLILITAMCKLVRREEDTFNFER